MNTHADPPAHWSVAEAKQRLSEVLRLAAQEPQPIYNRGRLVAALVDAEAFAAFERWRRAASATTIGAQFEALRAALSEAGAGTASSGPGPGEPPLPESPRTDRPNAFAAMLGEEFPPSGSGAPAGPVAKPRSRGQAAGARSATGRDKR